MLPARPAARKHFFFEKKKQKTFVTLARSYGQLGAKNQKSFWFFFSKKNILSSSTAPTAREPDRHS
jgi:hypothetical protein